MALSLVKGKASRVNSGVSIAVAPVGSTWGASSAHVVSLFVDKTPVQFASGVLTSITDGDDVAAVGVLQSGGMSALALHNLTSGSVYLQYDESWMKKMQMMAWACMIAGVVLTVVSFGLSLVTLVPMALYLFRKRGHFMKVKEMAVAA